MKNDKALLSCGLLSVLPRLPSVLRQLQRIVPPLLLRLLLVGLSSLLILSTAGCSGVTCCALIECDNPYEEDFTCEVGDQQKIVDPSSSVSFYVEWQGLGTGQFEVKVWNDGVDGTLVTSETVEVQNGQTRTFTWSW
jgi:hypothetical protein